VYCDKRDIKDSITGLVNNLILDQLANILDENILAAFNGLIALQVYRVSPLQYRKVL
jgi:hypothetical protein